MLNLKALFDRAFKDAVFATSRFFLFLSLSFSLFLVTTSYSCVRARDVSTRNVAIERDSFAMRIFTRMYDYSVDISASFTDYVTDVSVCVKVSFFVFLSRECLNSYNVHNCVSCTILY